MYYKNKLIIEKFWYLFFFLSKFFVVLQRSFNPLFRIFYLQFNEQIQI